MPNPMTSTERRAAASLATIMSLRMIGLFMVLPLFSLYAHKLSNSTPLLIGIAMGVYGLSQALLQIPFGMLSDHYGRRKIITIGLLLFIFGSVMAATAHTITGMIVGRALQGAGAVGSTLMAMIADLVRPQQRTIAMAMAGASIGAAFILAMMLGPILTHWLTLPGLFWITALLGSIGILLLFVWVPTPKTVTWHADIEPDVHRFLSLLKMPTLWQLNIGIFILHAIFTASFIAIPINLHNEMGLDSYHQGLLYLPVLLGAFLLSIPAILMAEKKQRIKLFYLSGIVLLIITECIFWYFPKNILISGLNLLLFLSAFSLLEAFLPSLVSRTAPSTRKGTALGMYSCSQFFGIFVGGVAGGWLYGQFGLNNIYLFCVILALIWVTISFKMNTGEIDHGKRYRQ